LIVDAIPPGLVRSFDDFRAGLARPECNRICISIGRLCRVGLDPPIRGAIVASRDSRLRGNDVMGRCPADLRALDGKDEFILAHFFDRIYRMNRIWRRVLV